ncbi:MAG TPA: STAS domain-containing protein [Opitutales bacterium]|jgi:anti-sigma B factor antagonist|nr:STAS domain-containing protein [Opitutales bacterium]
MELKIIRSDDLATHVALVGKLDLAGVQQIEMKFTAGVAARGKPAVVDLSETTYLASLGLRILLTTARALSGKGVKMVLLNPTEPVLQVLQLSKFDAIMPVETDLNRALATAGVK